ncbi:MAG: nitroreductase family protein [Deltaproteobacteria bacterium]|nr:nitroreductase family protein [Deltaproteobacteria bacterium]
MDVAEAIRERRTVRSFKGDDVSSEDLEAILEAVRWAPSWANTQCWEVVVVRDADRKQLLAETLSGGNPAKDAMTRAPVVMAVCAKRGLAGFYRGEVSTDKGDWYMFDTGLAVQNMCLRAHSLGLGSVIVGLFDAKRGEQILAVPHDRSLVVLVPIGHPEKTPRAPGRKEISGFVRYETYEGEPGK